MEDETRETLELLDAVSRGRAAVDALFPLLQSQLRTLARRSLRREPGRVTLQPTELVQEAYLRLVDQRELREDERTCFLGAAALAMRRVLVDRARARRARKRGGDAERVELDLDERAGEHGLVDLLDVHEALSELERRDGLRARVAELVLFSGLDHAEVAQVLAGQGEETSVHAVGRMWRSSRAWLSERLSEPS